MSDLLQGTELIYMSLASLMSLGLLATKIYAGFISFKVSRAAAYMMLSGSFLAVFLFLSRMMITVGMPAMGKGLDPPDMAIGFMMLNALGTISELLVVIGLVIVIQSAISNISWRSGD